MRSPRSSPSSTPGRSLSASSGPILVTGFGPFLQHERNPSQEAVCHYAASAGPEAVVAVLPVDPEQAPARALELVATHGARGLLAFGLGPGAAAIKVERLAVNRFEHAGAAHDLVPQGPGAL